MSFFEWVQNLQNFRWDEADVNRRLDDVMTQVLGRKCTRTPVLHISKFLSVQKLCKVLVIAVNHECLLKVGITLCMPAATVLVPQHAFAGDSLTLTC